MSDQATAVAPDADKTPRKHLDQYKWEKGKSGNPAGRPKGARNKLGEQFLEALQEDFEANGVAAIQRVREEKPDAYLKVIASLLPSTVNLNVNKYDDLTDEQLIEQLRSLDATLRPFLALEGKTGDGSGASAPTAH